MKIVEILEKIVKIHRFFFLILVYIKRLKLALRRGKNVVLKQLFLIILQKIKKSYG